MIRLLSILALATVALANVAPEDVEFYLSNTQLSFHQIKTGEYGLIDINPAKDVKIICHGWVDSIEAAWYVDTKAEYAKRGMTNVIGVDWSKHAGGLYSTAVNSVEDVGSYVALFILDLHKTYGIPLSKFHLIGHSLGAHISGFAGKNIKALTGELVGRITGLDPARPSFEGEPAEKRLSTGDALFVDVIHTDGGQLGIEPSIGDVDFFPNGGVARQNGCGILAISCSHNRAPRFFHEGINSDGFVAVACSSPSDFTRGNCANNQKLVMGENIDTSARGDFYLGTAADAPFALG